MTRYVNEQKQTKSKKNLKEVEKLMVDPTKIEELKVENRGIIYIYIYIGLGSEIVATFKMLDRKY